MLSFLGIFRVDKSIVALVKFATLPMLKLKAKVYLHTIYCRWPVDPNKCKLPPVLMRLLLLISIPPCRGTAFLVSSTIQSLFRHGTGIRYGTRFNGTPADPAVLKRLLGCDPPYHPASVVGDALKTWDGKYKALIDAPRGNQRAHGHVFLVQDREQEECF
ncbi:hypothetical protein F5Y04DRAFT_261416 [Hypomontagnella monticulosa]|nr:hypothetical protein F5Y04DRAFT_261416 [Hypomontagnella monticulosa]